MRIRSRLPWLLTPGGFFESGRVWQKVASPPCLGIEVQDTPKVPFSFVGPPYPPQWPSSKECGAGRGYSKLRVSNYVHVYIYIYPLGLAYTLCRHLIPLPPYPPFSFSSSAPLHSLPPLPSPFPFLLRFEFAPLFHPPPRPCPAWLDSRSYC